MEGRGITAFPDWTRLIRLVLTTILIGAILVTVAPPLPAQAAFPGKNGYVAFIRNGELWLMDPDGTDEVQFLTVPGANDYIFDPSVSPDGKLIAYGVYFADAQPPTTSIQVVDLETDDPPTPLQSFPGNLVSGPTWSPSGNKIAFSFPDAGKFKVRVLNSHNGDFIKDLVPSEASPSGYHEPAWSPIDENKLAVVHTYKVADTAMKEIATVTLDNALNTVVPQIAATFALYQPDWSPNATKIVFSRGQFEVHGGLSFEHREVRVVNANGSGLTALTPLDWWNHPVFSPEGDKVLMWGFDDHHSKSKIANLYTVSPDGGIQTPTAVPGAAGYRWDPSWAPIKTSFTVNVDSDDADRKIGNGVCDTMPKKGIQCSLRAALQESNAMDGENDIKFKLPKSESKTIAPKKPLPTLKGPTKIDGTTQPGAGPTSPVVILTGEKQTTASNGLVLESSESEIRGLIINSFEDAGISLQGEGKHLVMGNWFGVAKKDGDFKSEPSHISVEVLSNENDIGGAAPKDKNVFATSGDVQGLAKYVEGLKRGEDVDPTAHAKKLAKFGAAIYLAGGATNTFILGNYIGLAPNGSRIGSKAFEPAPFGNTFGVLILTGSDSITGTSIGGTTPGSGNVITGNFVGVLAASTGAAIIDDVDIRSNFIGPTTNGNSSPPFGNGMGVIASGHVFNLQLGSVDDGNRIQGNIVGAVLGGPNLNSASVQGNAFGKSQKLGTLVSALDGTGSIGLHNVIHIIMGDTQGVQVGGAGAAGNDIMGGLLGILLSGENSKDNVITGNKFGLADAPSAQIEKLKLEDYGSIMGILEGGGEGNTIGGAAGNTFKGTVIGLLSADTLKEKIQGNTFDRNAIGVLAGGPTEMKVGGISAGDGNHFERGGLGLLMANRDLKAGDREASRTADSPITKKDRSKPFTAELTGDTLDGADPLMGTSDLSADAVKVDPTHPGDKVTIQGNYFGTNASDTKLGNWVGAWLIGDFDQTTFGTGLTSETVGANTVAHNRVAGVWLGPTITHMDVDARGNSIYDNHTFTGPSRGLKGLGLDLIPQGRIDGDELELSFGPTDNDAGDPDTGANGLQNRPVLTGFTGTAGGPGQVTGSFNSKPSTAYTIELYANANCGKFTFGEAEVLIKRFDVVTDVNGSAAINEPVSIPVGKTIATASAFGAEGSSEFSNCQPLAAP